MKKLLCIIAFALVLSLTLVLASCGEDAPTIEISEDGYVVVNGVKTEYKVDKEDVITIEDGFVVVNGVKTEHEVKNKNHSFNDWKLYNEDETNCEKKLYYRTCLDCSTIEWKEGRYEDHDFATVTTPATCQAKGYDTKTCNTCGKVEVCNETSIANHTYENAFTSSNTHHWRKCSHCESVIDKAEHLSNADGYCMVCNKLLHNYLVELVYPTQSEQGYNRYTCTDCGDTYNSDFITLSQGFKYTVQGDTCTITDIGTCTDTFVVFPSTINGLTVTSIGREVFAGVENRITGIIIPNTITNIDYEAFKNCTNMETVHIGSGLKEIGRDAFYNCRSLKGVYICDIEQWCNITFNNYFDMYGKQANPLCHAGNLYLNGRLVVDLIIPQGVEKIAAGAFYGCKSIQSVTIPASVIEIGSRAFYGCSDSIYEYQDGIQYVDNWVVGYTNPQGEITLRNGTLGIAGAAFKECSNRMLLTLPDSVISISEFAFWECSNLVDLQVGNGLKYIGYNAFRYCRKLTTIIFNGTAAEWNTIITESWSYISFENQRLSIKCTDKNIIIN